MKILKRGATGAAQPELQSKQKSVSRSATPAATGTGKATVPAEGRVVTVRVRATLVQWLLATLIGIVAGAVFGVVVFTIFRTNW